MENIIVSTLVTEQFGSLAAHVTHSFAPGKYKFNYL